MLFDQMALDLLLSYQELVPVPVVQHMELHFTSMLSTRMALDRRDLHQSCAAAGHSSNKPCLDYFLASGPAPAVAALYGPVLTAKLSLAQAHWLLHLGRLPDFWKQTTPYTAVPAAVDAASAKGKPASAAAAPVAKEKACLDRASTLLQVGWTLLEPSVLAALNEATCNVKAAMYDCMGAIDSN